MAVNVEKIRVIADLLLGAAYADQNLSGKEEASIRAMLAKLMETDLPPAVSTQIEKFDAAKFDLAAAAKDFASDPPMKKRELLELVAGVHDADEELDLDEDAYMRKLAEALGMAASEYQDLSIEVLSIDDLKERFEDLVVETA
ncbi:MAG: TerB family tellurite resistance protein [Deltaproteobacteria bacterium]|nr:TerB family tellurite resistance protein [Deltaproteobacteria bacterium]